MMMLHSTVNVINIFHLKMVEMANYIYMCIYTITTIFKKYVVV